MAHAAPLTWIICTLLQMALMQHKKDLPVMNAFRIVVAAGFILGTMGPGLAFAACTQQDATGKANQLSQLVQAKMASDPSQGQALMAKMQPVMQSYQGTMSSGSAVDWDKVCGEYDALIKQAQ